MIVGRVSILLAAASALLATSAAADLPLDGDDRKCAFAVLARSAVAAKIHGKSATKCVRGIVKGSALEATVGDCVAVDANGKQSRAEQALRDAIEKACIDVPYAIDCPPPCDAFDEGGATAAIDDVSELADCAACVSANASWAGGSGTLHLAGAHARILDGVTLAAPPEKDLGNCQSMVVKAYDKLLATKLKVFVTCAKGAFKDGAVVAPSTCIGADPKDKIAKRIGKLAETVLGCEPSMPFDGGACAGLDAQPLADCLDAIVECSFCRWANIEIGSAVDCDAFDDGGANGSCADPNTTTTLCTTTTTATTTTTLAAQDPLCPDVAILTTRARITADACATNADCSVGTCDAATSTCFTATDLDIGFTGINHDRDVSDGPSVRFALRCTSGGGAGACGSCSVLGVDPSGGNCRCIDDNRTVCDEPFENDADHCGGALCTCYSAPPLPLSGGNASGCSLDRYDRQPTGSIDVDTGEIDLSTPVHIFIYFGANVFESCPVCGGTCSAGAIGAPCRNDADCGMGGVCGNFDATPNDGLRDGTCVGAINDGMSCDVHAVNRTLTQPGGHDGYSYDCFPSTATNITGNGLGIPVAPRTGITPPIAADLDCFFDVEQCFCGTCALDPQQACSSNADCGPCQGACTGGNSAHPNTCSDGVCTGLGDDKGKCQTGPDDKFCDAIVRLDGRGIIGCNSNTDCEPGALGYDAGDCTVVERRNCFPDPVAASGTAHPTDPIMTWLACSPPTVSPGANAIIGFPGPARERYQMELATLCASDPGTTYLPGVGGCP